MRRTAWTVFLLCAMSSVMVQAEPSESAELAEILGLRPGSRVADVGAGDGEWSIELADHVGDKGLVFATEIDSADVDELRSRFEEAGLSNILAIKGSNLESGLPAACCDAILLRLVYHHFKNPKEMIHDLARSLARGGRLVVIDIVPQSSWKTLEGVPEREGHGIEAEALEQELLDLGWRQVERREPWNGNSDKFGAVFVPLDNRHRDFSQGGQATEDD